MNHRQDINDLFIMFHDFEILNMKHDKGVLTIRIDTPFNEHLGIDQYIIILELYECDYVMCEYAERKDMNNNKTTNDCKLISTLDLFIEDFKFNPPDSYEFFCTGGNEQIERGEIKFNTNGFKLFDEELNPLSLDKMKELATMRWNSIQKMWDEQQNNTRETGT